MLCEKCANIYFRRASDIPGTDSQPGRFGYYLHHESLEAAARAAQDGCHLCGIIWGELNPYKVGHLHHSSLPLMERAALLGCHTCNKLLREARYKSDGNNNEALGYPCHDSSSSRGHKFAGQIVIALDLDLISNDNTDLQELDLTVRVVGNGPAQLFSVSGLLLDTVASPLVKMLSALTHCKQGRQSATKDLATIPFDLDGIIPRVVGADRASTYAPWADMCTLSTANLALASLWLQNCLRNHTPCANFQGSEGSPIRLLDLQDPKSPLLILTSDTEACDRYVTLSYKWGFDQEPEYRTTRANYKKRTEVGLLTERLPRTFREAIEVTVSLGFRYLWIDALCIIQDDYIDQEQINTMDQVFRNSTLTLFAALGEDPDAGLSVARDSRLSKPCSLNITVSVGEHTRRLASLSAFAPLHGWLSEDMFLLFRRGWALQEQILSPRGLVFGDQLSWRCVCGQHSESEPLYRSVVDDIAVFTRFGDGFDMDSSASRHCSVRYWLVRKDPLVHPSSTLKHIRPQDPFEAWYQIVEMYTLRTLRDGSDILRAIAGLASGLQRLHGGRYLVGLWEDDLQRGLLWYVESISSVESFHERPFARISSWTWVSQWGRNIQYYDGEPREAVHDPSESILIQHHGVHLLDHEFPMDSDNLAEMDHHVLNLRGRVKKATVCAPAVLGKSKSVTWSFPKWPGNVVDAASGSVVGQIALDYELESLVRLRGDSTKTISIYCLLSTVRQKATRWDLTCVGMTYDEEVDEFQRIGLVYISDRTWLGQFSADLKLGATLSEQSGLTRTVRLA